MEPQKNVNPAASDEDKGLSASSASQADAPTPIDPAATASPDATGGGMGNVSDASVASDSSGVTPPADSSSKAGTGVPADLTATMTPDEPSGSVSASADSSVPVTASVPSATDSSVPADSTVATPNPATSTDLAPADTSSNPVTPPSVDSGIPAAAPVVAPHNDKKTVFILLAVAVVLIAAIAILYFM